MNGGCEVALPQKGDCYGERVDFGLWTSFSMFRPLLDQFIFRPPDTVLVRALHRSDRFDLWCEVTYLLRRRPAVLCQGVGEAPQCNE